MRARVAAQALVERGFLAIELESAAAQRSHRVREARNFVEPPGVDLFRSRGPAQLHVERLAVRLLAARVLAHADARRRLRLVVVADRCSQALERGGEFTVYQARNAVTQVRPGLREP